MDSRQELNKLDQSMNDVSDQIIIHNPIANLNYKNFQDVQMKADSRHNSRKKLIIAFESGQKMETKTNKLEQVVNPEDNLTPVEDPYTKNQKQISP